MEHNSADGAHDDGNSLGLEFFGRFRAFFSKVVRSLVEDGQALEVNEARWATHSADAAAAIAGDEYVAGLDPYEVLDCGSLELAHRAVAETPGRWDDPDTFVATMDRYHELAARRDVEN